MTSSAPLWLKTFFGGFVIVSALLLATLFTPAPYGDLSRIGRLSDTEFGWRAPPPPMPAEAQSAVPLDQADILVVGDSFSMTFYWQAPLVRAGYKVSTIYWGQIGFLCADFSDWARQAGFKGKLVIVESVERLLDERLNGGERCAKMLKAPVVKTTPFMKPLTVVPGFALNWTAKLTSGVITYANTREARQSTTDTQYGDETQVRMVPDGCRQFSHRLCDRALFFKEDVDNPALTAHSVEQMRRFTASQSPRMLWMVIPNKTTVYVDPQHSKPFVDAFHDAGLGPDLFAFAQTNRVAVPDFYFPNDTHLSMHGQLILGERMVEAVREATAAASTKTP